MKRNKGMTFLEILIALVITGFVLFSLLAGVNSANRYVRHNANRTMALNYSQELLEEIKDTSYEDDFAKNPDYHTGSYTNFLGPEYNNVDPDPEDDDLNSDNIIERIPAAGDPEFDDVDDYNGYSDNVGLYQDDDTTINATREVTISDQDWIAVLDDAGYNSVEYKIVTVTVSWTWLDDVYTDQISTIVTQRD